MTDYTLKPFNSQGVTLHTNYKTCKKFSRCNNKQKCKTCRTIWEKKQSKKSTSHIKENHITQFKYKYMIEFNSLDTHKDHIQKNLVMNAFIDELRGCKRNKGNILNRGQYFIGKHISHSNKLGFNPHYHMIYLSNLSPKHNKHLKKLLEKYNISIHYKEITKTNNSFVKSIKKCISYIMKTEQSRIHLEINNNISKHRNDIYKSSMFYKGKFSELLKSLYIDIAELKAKTKDRTQKAKKIYRNYIKNNPKHKPHSKIIMIRSLKKKLAKIKTYYDNQMQSIVRQHRKNLNRIQT